MRFENEDPEERGRLARQARQHFVRSWKLDDSIPETYAGYGATYLLEGQDAAAKGRSPLEHAHAMLPSSVQIKLWLARLYARLGTSPEARELALTATTWGHSEEIAEEAQAILREVGAAGAGSRIVDQTAAR